MINEKKQKPDETNISDNSSSLKDLNVEDDKIKEKLAKTYEVYEETLKQPLSEYSFSLIPTGDSNIYKTTIEVSPALAIGSFKSKKEKKYIVANKLELIAESPNFSGVGKMTINVLVGTDIGSYSFGRIYDDPQNLKEDYLKLITKIRGKHMDNKGLKLKLSPLKSISLNSES